MGGAVSAADYNSPVGKLEAMRLMGDRFSNGNSAAVLSSFIPMSHLRWDLDIERLFDEELSRRGEVTFSLHLDFTASLTDLCTLEALAARHQDDRTAPISRRFPLVLRPVEATGLGGIVTRSLARRWRCLTAEPELRHGEFPATLPREH